MGESSHSPLLIMELFGPETVNSIAQLLGIETNQVKEQEIAENENVDNDGGEEANSYIIRKGKEKDVLQEVITTKKSESPAIERDNFSQYTYDDYKEEFERDRTWEELYEDDPRSPVEYEITDCQTFEAGKLPDKKFAKMKICLPEEDLKTIDIDVKAEKVLLFSYHYKCLAYWNGKIKPSQAQSTWDEDTCILTIKAPIN